MSLKGHRKQSTIKEKILYNSFLVLFCLMQRPYWLPGARKETGRVDTSTVHFNFKKKREKSIWGGQFF